MAALTHITFLRHGRARHNEDFEIRGEHAYFDVANIDAELTEKGQAQAQAIQLQGRLHREDFDAIFCSPLRRCRQTLLLAMPESRYCPVILDDRLMEPQGDAACNRRQEKNEISGNIPEAWLFDGGVNEENPFCSLKEGYSMAGQGFDNFSSRVRNFTEWLLSGGGCDTYRGKKILIVGHHDWIKTWHILYKGFAVSPTNCEIVETLV